MLGSVVTLGVGLGTSGHLLVAALGGLAVFGWWDRCTLVVIVELGALYDGVILSRERGLRDLPLREL